MKYKLKAYLNQSSLYYRFDSLSKLQLSIESNINANLSNTAKDNKNIQQKKNIPVKGNCEKKLNKI